MDVSTRLSKVAREIKPSGIRKYFGLVSEMSDGITLGVGEPDFVTPWKIRDAGIESLERGRTWYTANAGITELRDEVSSYLLRRFGLSYSAADETLVTVGGSEAIDLTIRAFVEPGDEVIIPQPSFVCYEPITRLCGGVPVIIETKAQDAFRLTAEALKAAITDKTKLLVLPFPCNPTGAVMKREHLEALAEVLRETGIIVLSDEIYAELTYGGSRHCSIASIEGMRERTVVINGFSKAYAMTGWRLGYCCAPKEIISVLTKLHQYAIMCAPTLSQNAAVVALRDCDEMVESMVADYDMRRRFVVDALDNMGLHCFEPEGAFYVFPDIRSTGMTSEEFCERLIEKQHVAVVPGTAFGESGEGFVRISYSYSIKHLAQAMKRIKEFIIELSDKK